MTVYTPEQRDVPVGLDEAGLQLGLERIPSEALYDFRRRLLLEARDPGSPTQDSFVRSVARKVGEFSLPAIEVNLVLDSDGNPVAPDPFVEVTSSRVRVWSDKDSDVVDFEVEFKTSRWVKDVYDAFVASSFFSAATLDSYEEYAVANHLRFGTTEGFQMQESLFESYQNRLQNKYVKEVWFSDRAVYQEEQSSVTAVAAAGDFWIDSTNGVVHNFDLARGNVTYSYRKFPYTLFWEPVRAVPFNDSDLDFVYKETEISDETGLEEYVRLNSQGSEIVNKVLAAHSIGWGE